ncbi:MAG: ferrous iron transporter B [Oscillospiraceae bacterium]|nr:ferrous iron transporter B [Oscillospiraceae bacterium]
MKTIALIGNPNSGKTTLFNALTGQRQFVGNWPGVTVQVKQGKLRGQNDMLLLDLPGIYSLTPLAPEETVACDALVNHPPDVILNIVDGTNLQRNLYLTMQLLGLGVPVIVAVNCADVLRKRGDIFSAAVLARELGCPVVEISALRGSGLDKLAGELRADLHLPLQVFRHESIAATYAQIERITARCMRQSSKPNMTERMDNIVLNRWLALPLFVLVMTGVYYLAAAGPGAWLGGWVEGAIAALGQTMPNTWLGSLVQEGVLGGAGMLLGFVPQLMMVFLCLSVLEASGYLSRVAFLLDAALRKFGLSGKCFMPMLLATGCSVPAILATRAIDCPRQRRAVAATCSFLPCSAKLPIIALMANGVFGGAWWLAPLMYFIGAAAMLFSARCVTFFEKKVTKKTLAASRGNLYELSRYCQGLPSGVPANACICGVGHWGRKARRRRAGGGCNRLAASRGIFNECAKSNSYSSSWRGSAIASPASHNRTPRSEEPHRRWPLCEEGCRAVAGGSHDFILEMPQYRLPSGRDIARSAWRRTMEFVKKAGSVIVLSGVFVWLLGGVLQPVGGAIAWLFVPLGFGFWQAAVATLTAFVAKENAVATLGVLGAAAMFSPASAMSFLLFNLLSMPCVAAVAALRRELGSTKRTLFAVGWQFAVAYVAAGCVYWALGNMHVFPH